MRTRRLLRSSRLPRCRRPRATFRKFVPKPADSRSRSHPRFRRSKCRRPSWRRSKDRDLPSCSRRLPLARHGYRRLPCRRCPRLQELDCHGTRGPRLCPAAVHRRDATDPCFNAATRSGTPDIGAYQVGTVTTVLPGTCVPPAPDPGMGGAGTDSGNGGAAGSNAGGTVRVPAALIGGCSELDTAAPGSPQLARPRTRHTTVILMPSREAIDVPPAKPTPRRRKFAQARVASFGESRPTGDRTVRNGAKHCPVTPRASSAPECEDRQGAAAAGTRCAPRVSGARCSACRPRTTPTEPPPTETVFPLEQAGSVSIERLFGWLEKEVLLSEHFLPEQLEAVRAETFRYR